LIVTVGPISSTAAELTLGRFRNLGVDAGKISVRRLLETLKQRSRYHIDLSVEEMEVVEDLLLRMWTISPKKRATAEELLGHRWLEEINT